MTHAQHKLSLFAAILVNINIMLGAGIFISTTELAKRAGALSSFAYILIGLLMLPLIISIAQLLKIHPSGGFYTYATKELHPFAGFISSWSYFTAKLASCTIMIHASVMLLQQLIPALNSLNPFALDISIIALFMALNMLNIKAGSTIQGIFTGLKIVPIFFAIGAGMFLFNPGNFSADTFVWAGIPSALPLLFYSTMGFEAACSLSSQIENAKRNAPLAIFISYGIVICIAVLYQTAVYGALGDILINLADYRGIFPGITERLFITKLLANNVSGLMHLAIASSALGGAYSIIFSNTWNLHTLAQHGHVFASRAFTAFNRNMIPTLCVLAQGAICCLYLFVTMGNQVYLQQLSSLGVAIAYTLSIVSLLVASFTRTSSLLMKIIPVLGLANCSLFIWACINNFMTAGASSLGIFAVLLFVGIGMFFMTPGEQQST